MYKILMVCTGNICRSPLAHGFLDHALANHSLDHLVTVDSAGTTAFHRGASPDIRSQKVALEKGIDLSLQRARLIEKSDYQDFDLILAMDQSHITKMRVQAQNAMRDKIQLYLDFSHQYKGHEVPDPYYGGEEGFYHVRDLIEETTEDLIKFLKSQLVK